MIYGNLILIGIGIQPNEIQFTNPIKNQWEMNQAINLKSKSARVSQLNKVLSPIKIKQQRVILPVEEGYLFRKPDQILSVHADGNYCEVICLDQSKIYISKTLKYVADQLHGHSFMRVHSSHLVNADYITAYYKSSRQTVLLSDGRSIPVSRARKQIVNHWMATF